MDEFDFVIVGAGSAGCALAGRLSEDPGTRVALLEAGGNDKSMLINMPAGIAQILPPENANEFNWGYWTEPQAALNGRRLYWPRGRALGGSSSINGMVYIRGHASDYDRWAQLGCTGWGWADVLPFFRKSEDSDRGACEYHGAGGPLATTRRMLPHELNNAFIDAAVEAGWPRTDDFNGPQFEGAGSYDSTIRGGQRWSAARAYLTPEVRRRPNLRIITGALAERVLFEGKRAVGVAYSGGQRVSGRRVILSGGAINSPQLLMLSGVGPGAMLKGVGLGVVADRGQVGQNLQDHLDVIIQWTCSQPITLNGNASPLVKVAAALNWIFRKSGNASYMPTAAGAFVSTREGLAAPDIQMHFMPVKGNAHGMGGVAPEHGYQVHVCQVRPESRGAIWLKSADPAAHPAIDPNYLSAPEDVETLLKGVEIARAIGCQPALAKYNAGEVWPGDAVQGPAVLERLKDWAETIYHPVGTCRMGPDTEAVTDIGLHVNGVEGLMVVDASVMPMLVSGNTNAPTIMIAEKAAAAIRAEQRDGAREGGMTTTPFEIPVHAEEVQWIRQWVEAFRFFEEPEGHNWEHGANRGYMERLRERWLTGHDWEACVARLNRFPNCRVEVEPGFHLHCIHRRSSRADARPLLIAHGWPGSILEFEAIIERLAEPEDAGVPAFHVVAPSLPGYAWSDRPKVPMGPRAVAGLYDRLMGVLGYDAYVYQGGDWGCVIGGWIGLDSSRVQAIHLNGYGLRSADMSATTPEEKRWLGWAQMIRATETGYLMLQATKPQSLGFAMMDSPMGVAAWLAEKYCGWSDLSGGQTDPPFPMDTLLDTIMIYLTTRSFLSATWIYRGMFLEGGFSIPEGRRIEVPTGVAAFPHDLLAFPPRSMVERGYNVVHWTDMPKGGHFAGLEEPELLLADIRTFFGKPLIFGQRLMPG